MARSIGAEERRARLALRHHVAPPARGGDLVAVARDMVGLHATDPTTVFLSAAARLPGLSIAGIESVLYDQRALVRLVGMRRTLFAVPIDVAPIVQAGAAQELAVKERQRLIQMVEQAGVVDDGDAWLGAVEADTLASITARGEAVAAEIAADVPELQRRILFGQGKKWEGEVALSTRVLFYLAVDGRIVRGRPRGSWLSGQYRWAPASAWIPPAEPLPTVDARVELARRWLAGFGPGRLVDLKWWTGWTVAKTKQALAGAGAVEVEIDGGTGFVLPDDLDPVPPVEPWAALLPSLDPTVMGWTERGWYLDPHGPALFDRNGNAGPTVWWDGRVVGGWGQGPDGHVVVRLLEDIGADGVAAVDVEADRLDRWLGGVRVTPRFRTPLERELGG